MVKLIGLDVGDARIGIASSDPLGIIAQPHSTLERKGKKKDLSALVDLVKKEGVGGIIVGLPLQLDGTEGEQAKKVTSFVKELEAELLKGPDTSNVFVKYFDERFTTHEASRVIQGSGLKNKERRQTLDRISAAVILRAYLEMTRNSAPR